MLEMSAPLRAIIVVVLIPSFANGQIQKPVALEAKYQVYDAVLDLMRFPKQDPYIRIANTTLNSGCGSDSGNPVLLNGCGIFGFPATADETYKLANQAFSQMEQSTWKDLIKQSASSETLHDSLKSPWPHALSDITKADSGAPKKVDGIIFLSRVGFNTKGNEAIVYVLFFSYMEHVTTSANIFLLRLNDANEWRPAGRFTSMETQ